MRRLLSGLFAMALVGTFSACSKPAAVKWPALGEMDTLAERAEGWIEANNVGELRKLLPEIKAAAAKLVSSGVPANAHEPKAVEQTLADLRNLAQQFEKPTLSDDEVKAQVAAIHPLVEKLMEQSGVPHVHDHHGHDH
jgi:hypothetical protein